MLVLSTTPTAAAHLRNGELFVEAHPAYGTPEIFRLYEAVPTLDGAQLALVVDRLDLEGWSGRNALVRMPDHYVQRLTGTREARTAIEELVRADHDIRTARARHAAAEPLAPATYCGECGAKLPEHVEGCRRWRDLTIPGGGFLASVLKHAPTPTGGWPAGEEVEPDDPREYAGDDEEQIRAAARTERYAAEERPAVASFDPDDNPPGFSAGGTTAGRPFAMADGWDPER